MAKVSPTLELKDRKDPHWNMMRKMYERLARVVNNQISFGNLTSDGNIDGVMLSIVTPGVANTDFSIPHTLGRLPVGFIVLAATLPAVLYNGSVAWTKTAISLRSTVAAASMTIFII